MLGLTEKEQHAVRVALVFLRRQFGTWAQLGKLLHHQQDSLYRVVIGRRSVTPTLAFRTARLADVGIDNLLAGEWVSRRVCPSCGRPPVDLRDGAVLDNDGQVNATRGRLARRASSRRSHAGPDRRRLTAQEQLSVLTALRFLRRRLGTWERVGEALHYQTNSMHKIVTGRRGVTRQLVAEVAHFTNVSVDTLLAGEWLSKRVCAFCGHPPRDFEDEETIVDMK